MSKNSKNNISKKTNADRKKPLENSPLADLNERSRYIMTEIIHNFLSNGQPIGSQTFVNQSDTPLSSATIRNEFSLLEDLGLLYSPHVSAGRLPTPKGLQLFVDGLMEVGNISQEERLLIESHMEGQGRSFSQTIDSLSKTLSGLSNYAGFVMAPHYRSQLKHIEFIPLSSDSALTVLVDDKGFVENRVIALDEPVPASVWHEAGRYLTMHLTQKSNHNLTLDAIRQNISNMIDHEQSLIHTLTRRIVKAGIATLSTSSDINKPTLILSGKTQLLQHSKDLDHLHDLLHALEGHESLLNLITATENAKGVSIFIGTHNKLFAMSGCSAIISPITNADSEIIGAIGVLGPTRMNYGHIIPLVDYTAKIVNGMMRKNEYSFEKV